jgi:hypothetical protein
MPDVPYWEGWTLKQINAYWSDDYYHDRDWEREITEEPVIQTEGEPDYSFIDRLFKRLEEME